jgi:hypothetical protein
MYGLCYCAIQRQLALALSLFLEIYSLLTNRQRVLPGTNDIGSVHGYENKNIFPLSSLLIIDVWCPFCKEQNYRHGMCFRASFVFVVSILF